VSAATQMGDLPGAGLDAAAGPRRGGAWAAAFRSPAGVIGLVLMVIVVVLALMSLFGLTPYSPSHQNVAASLRAPGGAHWFGTDQFGRDVFSRVASGVANSLRIAIVSVAAASVAGTLLGVLAGYYQGIVDRVVGVITNVLFAFPSLLLALALAATLARSWLTVSLSIAIVYMPIFARVSRAPVLTLRSADYVLASTAIGRRRLSTLFEHILPNIRSILVVQVTLSLSWAILTEASLSFLGFGTQPPQPSWGRDMSEARRFLGDAPWMFLAPTGAIMLCVLSINFMGDGLRDALDPRAWRTRRTVSQAER
jgi:peptide/nickel transport system permease protein